MSIEQAEEALIRRLNALGDWMARYDYLMMAGAGLEELEECERTDENRIWGCQSKVWLDVKKQNEKLYIRGYSPSLIVRGFIAILRQLVDGRSCGEILQWQMLFFEAAGFDVQLGVERKVGMAAMISRIKEKAKE